MRSLVVVMALALAVPAVGCRRGSAGVDAGITAASVVVRDDTQGLLLTWIDEKGDFHVEQKVTEVPLAGRDQVRVVDPNREEGSSGDAIFLADLRVARADGTYPVQVTTRDAFDGLALARRAKRAPTLANVAPSSTAPNAGGGSGGNATEPSAPGSGNVAARPAVIIYGASWCSACHDAQRYLRSRGIAFIEKDVEQEPGAAAEMRQKLARAGIHNSGSIPVIDVRGRILVGFSAREIESALGSPI